MKWLIWSFEHQAWWKSSGWGYTRDISKARQYEYDQAVDIVTISNNCHASELPQEAMVPVPAIEHALKDIAEEFER